MNASWLNETKLETVDSNNFVKMCTLILLGFVFLIGTIGNLLVLGVYVYHHVFPQSSLKHRNLYRLKQRELTISVYGKTNNVDYWDNAGSNEQLFSSTMGTPSFFILVLACVDLFVCCVVVPIVFYMEYIDMKPNWDLWCKTYTFLTVCNIMFSSLLIIAIALDRYLAICHPLEKILTMSRAKYLTLGLAIFCIIYGILAAIHSKLSVKHKAGHVKQCYETMDLESSTQTEKIVYIIIQKGNTASFVLSIVCVLVLYSLILNVVIRTHRKNAQREIRAIPIANVNNTSNLLTNSVFSNEHLMATSNNYLKTPNSTDQAKENIKKLRFSLRGIAESRLWRELRSASVLFVVAVVYIIVFVPALLIANKLIDLNIFAFNTYFLNNVSNPLIYCFMSKTFRKRLKILLCGWCIDRNGTYEDKILFTAPPERARPRLRPQRNDIQV